MYNPPPSQLPLATVVKDSRGFARTSTASRWPPKLSTKGLAKILSSLAAFSALVRSLAFAKGCMLGLRFRWTGVGSPGRWGTCRAGLCCKTVIFWGNLEWSCDEKRDISTHNHRSSVDAAEQCSLELLRRRRWWFEEEINCQLIGSSTHGS